MNHPFQRRHSLWYERLLFSGLFQFILGTVCIVLLPAWQRWPDEFFAAKAQDVKLYTLMANMAAYLAVFLIIRRLRYFPNAQTISYVLPTIALSWLLVVAVLFFLRLDYSRYVLMLSFLAANLWAVAGFYVRRKFRMPKIALVPMGRALSLKDNPGAHSIVLQQPDLGSRRFDAIVADLHSDDLSAEWERFLARCTLAHIPVFHFKQMEELLTGKVRIERLAENEIGSLLPSPFYSTVKRVLDLTLALLLLPALLLVMLLFAVWIKLDSEGSVFFIQERLGFRGNPFKVYKFRSMYTNMAGQSFTEGENDPRITRVGKVIRKFRIDELPQIINVLKGDMSFIGPRPESKELSDWYEEAVPFFSYRHVVRPGISGWAQVNQGYAAEVEGMKEKLQYDFYYIKHFSLWLDILILFKTIRTVLTGYGAR